MSIEATLRALYDADHPDEVDGLYRPLRMGGDDPETPRRLGDIVTRSGIALARDTILHQLMELMEIRAPAETLTDDELRARALEHIGDGSLDAYGNWIYFPWSKRLVHVLPEAELREVRLSRNRNKITVAEQQVLRSMRIGVVGLSVGRATALTLAMEGIGAELRLADFDRLSVSNMNRLRAGVHDIGANKAVLAAREIAELNPYARVTIFPEGITEQNIDAFLHGGEPLSLLFEECDDLYMKVRLREGARARRIPVVMETSDRGLIDIERFDLEPERPILHGLVGDIEAESLRGLDTYDKVPVVMRILGQKAISTRLAASMVEIQASLTSWPQLASDVALGGALTTSVARRIALGDLQRSGRYYVDLEQIIRDDRVVDIQVDSDDIVAIPESTAPAAAPKLHSELDAEQIRSLVTFGTMAPSGGNVQPWRFEYDGRRLRCIHDLERSVNYLDWGHRATYLAFGAVTENIVLAAEQAGLETEIRPFPEAPDRTVVCDLTFSPRNEPPRDSYLFEQITRRVTNRRLSPRQPLDPHVAGALREAAWGRGAQLHLCTSDAGLDAMADILAEGDRLRFLDRRMHREMMGELRWSAAEAERTRDGVDLATLELSATDLAGLRITSLWSAMELVGKVGGGRALGKPMRKSVAAASAIGLLTVPSAAPVDFFRGGRGLQRLWLATTAQGYAFQPVTALSFLFLRLVAGEGEDMPAGLRQDVERLRRAFLQQFPLEPGESEVMLFRLSKAGPPTARALRRPIEDILTFHGTSTSDPGAAAPTGDSHV